MRINQVFMAMFILLNTRLITTSKDTLNLLQEEYMCTMEIKPLGHSKSPAKLSMEKIL